MRFIFLLVLVPLLSACGVSVGDLGEYWDKGAIDSSLTGKWKLEGGPEDVVEFTRKGIDYHIIEYSKDKPPRTSPGNVRVLYVNAHTFLMMRSDEGDHNSLVRYDIKGDKLITYLPNENMRESFVKRYPDSGINVIDSGNLQPQHGDRYSVEIPELTPEVVSLIGKLADDPRYWVHFPPPLTRQK